MGRAGWSRYHCCYLLLLWDASSQSRHFEVVILAEKAWSRCHHIMLKSPSKRLAESTARNLDFGMIGLGPHIKGQESYWIDGISLAKVKVELDAGSA